MLTCVTSNFSSDDNKLVEFFRIHMLFTPLGLTLVLQYQFNPSLMVVKILVSRRDNSFLCIYLMESCAALGSSTSREDLGPLLITLIPLTYRKSE